MDRLKHINNPSTPSGFCDNGSFIGYNPNIPSGLKETI